MKTEVDIRDDVYFLLKESALIGEVSGKLSKTLRPEDSDKEDVVVSLLTPVPYRQVQEVYLNVNVYVADIKRDNHYEENTIRLRKLITLCKDTFGLAVGKPYRLTLEEQKVMVVPGRNEHFINNKVLYQYCNG